MKTLRAMPLTTLLCVTTAFAADDLAGAHDFDFEFGDWTVRHRVKRPTGEWYEFDGTSNTRPVLDGLGNAEDNLFHPPQGDTRGLAIRVYDPASGTWAIWWIDSRAPLGAGVLVRRRQDLGDELGDGVQAGPVRPAEA